MRTAIIGTGFIGAYHRDALYAMGLAPELVVSRRIDRARAFAPEAHTAEELTEELLDTVDCVILCTPPALHFDIAARCLRVGKHLLCEKPLCLDPAQARELAQLAANSPGICAVNFNNRFFSGIARLRQMAKAVQSIRGTYLQAYHLLPAPFSWRYTDPMRATTEIGSHLIDLVTYVTGEEIISVRASFVNRTPYRVLRGGLMYADGEGTPIEVHNEDEAMIDFTMSGGGCGHFELSEIARGHENDLRLELQSDQGTFVWSNDAPDEIVFNGEKLCDGETGGFMQTFSDTLRAFYDSIACGRKDPRLCSFGEAARNVAVCDAIFRSSRSGTEECSFW